MDLDLDWDVEVEHRKGAEENLLGIDVFHEFPWLEQFNDERTQFRNGKCLAKFVKSNCPADKVPALLLTLRDGVRQGFHHSDNLAVFVVNVEEYRHSEGDTALSYLAMHLGVDITDVEQLQEIAAGTDPDLLRAFIESRLDVSHIADWVLDNQERVSQLRDLTGDSDATSDLGRALDALEGLADIPEHELNILEELIAGSADHEPLLTFARAVAGGAEGRQALTEALAERTTLRIQDARQAVAAYRILLTDADSNETAMQHFIEEHPWLLGLEYGAVRPRQAGPSGVTDFMLERFDGFQDVLELKSPQDGIIRAPESLGAAPPPHEYSLSPVLAQALAQALVYRDRLTRHADAAEELYGLRQTRDPRLLIVIGRIEPLQEHKRLALAELNRSLHRIEIVPYDILARRAEAGLDNVELYLGSDQSTA